MPQPPFYVGVDVGGSSIKGGVVDDAAEVLSSVHVPTEAHLGQEHGLDQMARTVREAVAAAGLSLDQIAAIGVATPGTMDIAGGMILDPPNLKPWKNVPVRDHIHKTFNLPTAFQNDANAAAIGEHWAGAGRGVHSLVLFTLGTGVGGGIVIGDLVVEGEHSHGAELGHMKIEMTQPRQCGCGRWGCLEAYASATSVVKRTLDAVAGYAGPTELRSRLEQKDAAELTAEDVFDAAKRKDPLADRLVEETAYYLAVGAMNMMHTIDPDVIVFGGGMIETGEWFLERIHWHIRKLAFPVPAAKTRVLYAQLGSDAGFIGAAACARLLHQRQAKSRS